MEICIHNQMLCYFEISWDFPLFMYYIGEHKTLVMIKTLVRIKTYTVFIFYIEIVNNSWQDHKENTITLRFSENSVNFVKKNFSIFTTYFAIFWKYKFKEFHTYTQEETNHYYSRRWWTSSISLTNTSLYASRQRRLGCHFLISFFFFVFFFFFFFFAKYYNRQGNLSIFIFDFNMIIMMGKIYNFHTKETEKKHRINKV